MEDRNVATGEVRELETVASVNENWERYPCFGEYASICTENGGKGGLADSFKGNGT